MKTVKCVYHGIDLDGYCSGAIVGHALGWENVEFIPMNYGWEFPWDDFGPEDTVYMLDFGLQPYEQMRKLEDKVKCLIWLDHHVSNIDEEDDWLEEHQADASISGIRDTSQAGCELTWTYFYGKARGRVMPWAVRLLGRYDVWKWEGVEGALEFNMGMRAYGNLLSPKNAVEGAQYRRLWDRLIEDNDEAHYEIEHIIRNKGVAILQYKKHDEQLAAEGSCFQTTICGVPVIAANVGGKNSQFFDSVLGDFPEAKAVMTFHYRKGRWNISLYQIDGRGTPDLSIIATDLGLRSEHGGGGGGHAGAAGLQWHCWGLPFAVDLAPKTTRGD